MSFNLDMNSLTAYLPGSPVMFSLSGMTGMKLDRGFLSSSDVPPPKRDYTATPWALWGDNNDWPAQVIAATEKNGVATQCLEFWHTQLYGRGPTLYTEDKTSIPGKVNKILVDNAQIEEFFEISNIKEFFIKSFWDYSWQRNPFVQIKFDRDGKFISTIKAFDPTNCRFGKMTAEKPRISEIYISSNWPSPSIDEYKKFDVLDAEFPLLDLQNREIKPGSIFFYPMQLRRNGHPYYDVAPWHGLVNTWIQIANSVPALKAALFTNMMTIKYHIEIAYKYWDKKTKGQWENLPIEKQREMVSDELDNFNKFFTGTDKTGQSLISHFDYAADGTAMPMFKITPIEDKLKDAAFIPDSEAANKEITFQMGIHPGMIGRSMGSSESGSGSVVRDATRAFQTRLPIHRELMLRPLERIVWPWNKFDRKVKVGFPDLDIGQSMDENPTGRENVMK